MEVQRNKQLEGSGKRIKYVIGITTYNRLGYLKRCVSSWNETRDRESDWTLIIADDGSTDGTIEYIEKLPAELVGVDVVLIKNNRVGVHRQTNEILKRSKSLDFDFGFKIDDDLIFIKRGWDNEYYSAAERTGFHHLIFDDKGWRGFRFSGSAFFKPVRYNGLTAKTEVINSLGAFWTFNREVIEKIGFFDEVGFGACGWGHVDWSWRACRAGFNREESCFDLESSNEYLSLIKEDYYPAITSGERKAWGNTSMEEASKIRTMKDSRRLYIGPPDSSGNDTLDVDDNILARESQENNKVTVVIPCYKHSHFLERSIASVVDQRYNGIIYIIVVDDGSSDKIGDVFSEIKLKYKNQDMTLIRQRNKGLSSARNTGFSNAKTKWVIPLDADDELSPVFVRNTMIRQRASGADIVYTDVNSDKHGPTSMNFSKAFLAKSNSIVCTALIRKRLWDDVGGYDESMKSGFEDWEFWIRCYKKKAKFEKEDGFLFQYHDNKRSMLDVSNDRRHEVLSHIRTKHYDLYAGPRISIVVNCDNECGSLERCIRSISTQSIDAGQVQVIVVYNFKNGAADSLVKELRGECGIKIRAKMIEGSGECGEMAGIAISKAEWVMLLDPNDILPHNSCVEDLLVYANDATLDVVGIEGDESINIIRRVSLQKEEERRTTRLVSKGVCDLTVVLSAYNQMKTLPMVLRSFMNQTKHPKQVIINDDGSTDGTLEYLDSLSLPFELKYVTRKHSWYKLASGNNHAAKNAIGSRILFTNADILHNPKSFESHSSLDVNCIGGGVILGVDVEHSGMVGNDMVNNWKEVVALSESHPSPRSNMGFIEKTNPNINPIGVWGGNFSVPRSVFEGVDGYNEEYDVGWGGEENDLVKRCTMKGCKVRWVMNSKGYHLDHPVRAYAYSMLGSKKYIK